MSNTSNDTSTFCLPLYNHPQYILRGILAEDNMECRMQRPSPQKSVQTKKNHQKGSTRRLTSDIPQMICYIIARQVDGMQTLCALTNRASGVRTIGRGGPQDKTAVAVRTQFGVSMWSPHSNVSSLTYLHLCRGLRCI